MATILNHFTRETMHFHSTHHPPRQCCKEDTPLLNKLIDSLIHCNTSLDNIYIS